MGRDGASGLLAMRQRGARTLGQSEASCVIYGMPRVAKEFGAVESEMTLDRIADEIART
jgi:two-component system chemotaxis response regulator CheB